MVTQPTGPSLFSRQAVRAALVVLALTMEACRSAGDSASAQRGRDALVAELGRIRSERSIAPRLSIPVDYRLCSDIPPVAGTVPSTVCRSQASPSAPSPALLDLAARASARAHTEADPGVLQAAALIDLVWAPNERIPGERSVAYLRAAARRDGRPAPMLADLAAALMVRAGRDQTPRDLLEAIESADRAVELDPRDSAARFNLALGLDLLGLDGQAAAAWRDYLTLDSTSGWAAEARRRARARSVATPPPVPDPEASLFDFERYAAAAPAEALQLGWDRLLDVWGKEIIAGDSVGATRELDRARAVGQRLVERGGDGTLADAVTAIDATTRHPRLMRGLAQAHRDYASARRAYDAGRYTEARRSFHLVERIGRASPSLVAWARLQLASTLVYEGRPDAADAVARPVATGADTLRQPSLAARARWVLGTALLRRGRYEQAIDAYRPAATLFARAGERQNVGAILHLVAETQQYLGDAGAEYPAIYRALTALRPYRSIPLHNLLFVAARAAAADGFPRTAARIHDEDVLVAEAIGRPIYLAEARISRARHETTAGDTARAGQDLAVARGVIERLPPGAERDWFEADLRLARAQTELATRAEQAIPALDSVVAFFGAQHNAIRQLPAIVARSEASLNAGRVSAGVSDLDRALAMLAGQSAATRDAGLRASVLETARQLADRLVLLRLAAGDTLGALADLERVRMSLSPAGRAAAPGARVRPAAAPGEIGIDYALVGDTILIWTVADTVVRLTRVPIDRDSLITMIRRVRSALELRVADPATLDDLDLLYDRLVRPVESQLGRDGSPLAVIADGEVAALPFPALHDARRRRYLIEAHPLRFGASLRDATSGSKTPFPHAPRVLLIADPAFDPRVFPQLAPLPGAQGEAGAIAAEYPGAVTLAGSAASAAAFETALHQADMVHYAGHALFDDVRPEQSSLALAPDPDRGSNGRLTAAEMERLDLRGVRLVVLSACETARPYPGRSAGFAGLSGSLLAAGAGGVLGTLWRVDDALTLQLMAEFHRAYRRSGDASHSLREAQLSLLRSPDTTLRTPAAWGAFRYMGH